MVIDSSSPRRSSRSPTTTAVPSRGVRSGSESPRSRHDGGCPWKRHADSREPADVALAVTARQATPFSDWRRRISWARRCPGDELRVDAESEHDGNTAHSFENTRTVCHHAPRAAHVDRPAAQAHNETCRSPQDSSRKCLPKIESVCATRGITFALAFTSAARNARSVTHTQGEVTWRTICLLVAVRLSDLRAVPHCSRPPRCSWSRRARTDGLLPKRPRALT